MSRFHTLGLVFATVVLAACAPIATAPPANTTGIVVNDGGQVEEKRESITLVGESPAPGSYRVQAAADLPYDITYVAQVLPVTVGSALAQANDVVIAGNRAYIAYNVAGEAYGGALQVVDISDDARPKILKEVRFSDLDVNCLYLDGGDLLFGGSSNPDKWKGTSFVGRVTLSNVDPAAIATSIKVQRSFAVTAITRSGNQLVAGVGAKNGGLVLLDASLTETSFVPRGDVRDLETTGGAVLAIAGTTDSTEANSALVTYDFRNKTELTLDNGLKAYAKATVEVDSGGLAYVALSNLGLRVVDTKKSNDVVFTLANPAGATRADTNSVSTDGDLMFAANGEYGFRVLRLLDKQAKSASFASLVGYHALNGATYGNKSLSVNHLAFRNDVLFAACGAGGVNVYTLKSTVAASPSPRASSSPTEAGATTPATGGGKDSGLDANSGAGNDGKTP